MSFINVTLNVHFFHLLMLFFPSNGKSFTLNPPHKTRILHSVSFFFDSSRFFFLVFVGISISKKQIRADFALFFFSNHHHLIPIVIRPFHSALPNKYKFLFVLGCWFLVLYFPFFSVKNVLNKRRKRWNLPNFRGTKLKGRRRSFCYVFPQFWKLSKSLFILGLFFLYFPSREFSLDLWMCFWKIIYHPS